MELVNIKMTAMTPSTMAAVPEILPVKYNTATTMADTNLIRRSIVPMFFFIVPYPSISVIPACPESLFCCHPRDTLGGNPVFSCVIPDLPVPTLSGIRYPASSYVIPACPESYPSLIPDKPD